MFLEVLYYLILEWEINIVEFIGGIIASIVAALVFEFIKKVHNCFLEKCANKARGFSINGYWIAYVEPESQNENIYDAIEVVKITSIQGKLVVNIFQTTSDKRKHEYVPWK